MKNIFIILGNGFSIDFLNHLKSKTESCADNIALSNLFENGELVPWPGDDSCGFLSYKHCPNLWTLGARPNLSPEASLSLIENIITCANVINSKKLQVDSIYIRAYRELALYLKALFIYYDKKVDVPKINSSEWGWAKYFQHINTSGEVDKVHLVTLNYDIWLERVLQEVGIDFHVSGFDSKETKFNIYKPHGSISFAHKQIKVKEFFNINHTEDIVDVNLKEFELKYANLNALGLMHAMIPPAGDSARLNFKWANEIRNSICEISESLSENDEVVICGISYWHVDRLELDNILTSIGPNVSEVTIVNPFSPEVFNAVTTTLFKNVKLFKNSQPLVQNG